MARALALEPLPERDEPWALGPILDQLQTNSCVGQSFRQILSSEPVVRPLAQPPSALDIYRAAVLIDEWPENDGQDLGTSVRAGAKYLQQLGILDSYVWAQSVEDVVSWVRTRGPVVIGSRWYKGMDTTDAQGFVQITGSARGGHAYVCYWADRSRGVLDCASSWGLRFGLGGKFRLRSDQLATLMQIDAEICAPVEVPIVQPANYTITDLTRWIAEVHQAEPFNRWPQPNQITDPGGIAYFVEWTGRGVAGQLFNKQFSDVVVKQIYQSAYPAALKVDQPPPPPPTPDPWDVNFVGPEMRAAMVANGDVPANRENYAVNEVGQNVGWSNVYAVNSLTGRLSRYTYIISLKRVIREVL